MKTKKKSKVLNREMAIVTYITLTIFLCMAGYLIMMVARDNTKLLNNSYNKRQELLAQTVTRGQILSSDDKVLAETKTNDTGKEYRYYPYGDLFCHVVGRNDHGKTGLEASNNVALLTSNINPLSAAFNQLRGVKNPGDTIKTTLNVKLQKIADQALGSHKGAVVVLDPSSGKCLAMVSKPDYDPNKVNALWNSLIDDKEENSTLVNRATQGLYPPGSTFKLITALTFMRQDEAYKDFSYTCKGHIDLNGEKVNCYKNKWHGKLDLTEAVAKSCNSFFAKVGTQLNVESFNTVCNSLYFNKELPIDFDYNKSSFSLDSKSSTGERMQTAIGQGKTLISPLHNAMLVSAMVNGGTMMKPYLVDQVEDAYGTKLKTTETKSLGSLMSETEAKKLVNMMDEVVENGTATSLNNRGYRCGGKTGSAEFSQQGDSHAWFVGYSSKGKKKLVVSVVVEGAGTGSDYAVPIARQIFDAYWD